MNSSSGISDVLRIRPGDFEHFGDVGAGLQRAFGASLDHGAVGDGIGERNAQLDQIRAAAFERGHQFGRALAAMGSPAVR